MIYIKQYGAKRTGTNYLRWLLEANFDNIIILTNILGWKHGCHVDKVDWSGKGWDHRRPKSSAALAKMVTPELIKAYNKRLIRYSVLIKNPYAYYVSNVRLWPSKDTHKRAHELASTWNMLYSNWTKIGETKWGLITRFEDILLDKKEALNDIADKFKLVHVDNISDTNRSLRALNESTIHKSQFIKKKKFNASFYLNKEYMNFIDKKTLEILNKTLDKELMKKFGYPFER